MGYETQYSVSIRHKDPAGRQPQTECLNRVEMRGTVVAEPRFFRVGDLEVARFAVGTQHVCRDSGGQAVVQNDFFNCSAWSGQPGITDFRDLKKGAFVALTGRLRNNRYTDRDGNDRYITEILCRGLEVLDLTAAPEPEK